MAERRRAGEAGSCSTRQPPPRRDISESDLRGLATPWPRRRQGGGDAVPRPALRDQGSRDFRQDLAAPALERASFLGELGPAGGAKLRQEEQASGCLGGYPEVLYVQGTQR